MSYTFTVNGVKCRSWRRKRKVQSLLNQVSNRPKEQRLVVDKPGVVRNAVTGEWESPDLPLEERSTIDLKAHAVFRLDD